MVIDIPKDVALIIKLLNDNGHEAFAVGGCVRDSILGRKPMDWDITTSAKPEEIKSIFVKTIDTGIAHGTVTVRLNGESYEVTTYRIDGEYEDSRHPKSVEFTTNLSEDLLRRDFTINAMAYSPDAGIVDLYGGIEDLEKGIIRCVGNPYDRFSEDALRTLRAVRFAGQLDFTIEQNTFAAIKELSGNIVNVSAERIRVEIAKLLASDHPDRLSLLYETGLSKVFLPEWDVMMETEQNTPHHLYTVGKHTIKVIEGVNKFYEGNDEHEIRILTWAAFLHDVAKPVCKFSDGNGTDHFFGHPEEGCIMAKKIMQRLKFDNYTIKMVSKLIKYHDYRFEGKKRAIRRFLSEAEPEIMPLLFILMKADIYGQSDYRRDEKLEIIARGQKLIGQIISAKDPVCLKDLAVSGKDLIEAGFCEGQEIGLILKELLDFVIDYPELNQKNYLLDIANEIANDISKK